MTQPEQAPGAGPGVYGASLDLRRPRRTSPLAALFWIFRGEQLRAALPVLVIAASSGRAVAVVLVGAAAGVASGVLSWWRRTWSFADGVLQLDEGVLVRNQRRIPVERIQHVELERRLRHQLFDLASVRVETAGGSGAELRLDTISLAEAEAIRSLVLERLRTIDDPGRTLDDGQPPSPPPAPEVLVRLPPGRLLLAGVTGPEVVAVLAALAFALDTLTDFGVDPEQVDGITISRPAVGLAVIAAVVLWFGAAGLIGMIRRWDLTASIVGDELRVTYGLLRKNEFVVKTARVQDVRIAHRFLLRPFDRADVRIRTAASGSGDQSRVDIPLLAADEIDRVLARVLPAATPLPPLDPAPEAARRRALIRSTVAGAMAAFLVGMALLATSAPALAVVPIALVPAGALRGELAYRGLGHAGERGVIHSRTGTLTRHRMIVPRERVQSGATVASWFQRRRDLASVRLDLASGAVAIVDRRATESRSILARATGDVPD